MVDLTLGCASLIHLTGAACPPPVPAPLQRKRGKRKRKRGKRKRNRGEKEEEKREKRGGNKRKTHLPGAACPLLITVWPPFIAQVTISINLNPS